MCIFQLWFLVQLWGDSVSHVQVWPGAVLSINLWFMPPTHLYRWCRIWKWQGGVLRVLSKHGQCSLFSFFWYMLWTGEKKKTANFHLFPVQPYTCSFISLITSCVIAGEVILKTNSAFNPTCPMGKGVLAVGMKCCLNSFAPVRSRLPVIKLWALKCVHCEYTKVNCLRAYVII